MERPNQVKRSDLYGHRNGPGSGVFHSLPGGERDNTVLVLQLDAGRTFALHGTSGDPGIRGRLRVGENVVVGPRLPGIPAACETNLRATLNLVLARLRADGLIEPW